MDERIRKLAFEAGVSDEDALWVKSLGRDQIKDFNYDNNPDIKDFEWPDILLDDMESADA